MARCRQFRINMAKPQRNIDVPLDLSKQYYRQPLVETVKLFDGSFGEEMRLHYHPDNTSRWSNFNKTHEDIVRQVHTNFLNAGANIIRTSTTGAFFSAMNKYDQQVTEEKYNKLITTAVETACDVVTKHNRKSNIPWKQAAVVGSCGHFEPTTGMTRDEIKNEYRRLMKTLSAAGIRTFCLQDIQSTAVADMLVELLEELQIRNTSAFMMFKPNRKGFLNDGTNWAEYAVRCYNKISLIAVGISCVRSEDAFKCLEMFTQGQYLQRTIPLVVCTNKMGCITKWQPLALLTETPAIVWEALGIRYIGGCCGVGAQNIQCIREELKRYNGTSV